MPRAKKKSKVPPPFAFPSLPHKRVHGPQGHVDYGNYKPWLRDEFEFRCVYCLTRELWSFFGKNIFEIDHVLPQKTHPRLTCDYDNLVYACGDCNSLKSDRARTARPLPDQHGQACAPAARREVRRSHTARQADG